MRPWAAGGISGYFCQYALGAVPFAKDPSWQYLRGAVIDNGFDNKTGAGRQLSAIETVCALLVTETGPPTTLLKVIFCTLPDNVTITLSMPTAEGTFAPTARLLLISHQGASNFSGFRY